jgi:rubrerythrin
MSFKEETMQDKQKGGGSSTSNLPSKGQPYYLEFSTKNLLELGIWMEVAGAEYYRHLASKEKNEKIRNFYLRLMGVERQHEDYLRKVYKEVTKEDAEYLGLDEQDLTAREYLLKLREVARNKIFGPNFDVPDPDKITCEEDCLNAALEAEMQSVALYKYLSRFKLYGKAKEVVQKLKQDEEGHIEDINKIIADLGL